MTSLTSRSHGAIVNKKRKSVWFHAVADTSVNETEKKRYRLEQKTTNSKKNNFTLVTASKMKITSQQWYWIINVNFITDFKTLHGSYGIKIRKSSY